MCKTKIKKIGTLFIAVIMIASCFTCSASAAGTPLNNQGTDTGSFNIELGTTKRTIVGKQILIWDNGLNSMAVNTCGWISGTNTLYDIVAIGAGTKYTGYVTIEVVNYLSGSTVVSSARSVGTKISGSPSNTWYKELSKASYTSAVTSFATVEATYSSSDYYYGYPNLVNVSK